MCVWGGFSARADPQLLLPTSEALGSWRSCAQNNDGVMTVHTKLIMSVSPRNKGEGHVQPQQGPKLIPQPQSRHTAQHASGQTRRPTGKNVCTLLALCAPKFRLHPRHKNTFLPPPLVPSLRPGAVPLGLCNICASPEPQHPPHLLAA